MVLISECCGAIATTAILTVSLIGVSSAHAGHPLITDDSGTLGGGSFELELSVLGQRPSATTPRVQLDFAVAVHVGLLSRLDAGASFGYELVYGDSGQHLLPPVLDLKLALWRGETVSLALRADYTPPFSGPLSSGGHDLGALVLVTRSAARVQLSFNGGVYFTQLCCPDHTNAALLAASALSVTLRRLMLSAEVVGVLSPSDGALSLSAQLAAAYNFSANHWLSVGAGPLYERSGSVGVSVTVGITLAFSAAKPR